MIDSPREQFNNKTFEQFKMVKIELHNLRFFAHHGLYEEERKVSNELVLAFFAFFVGSNVKFLAGWYLVRLGFQGFALTLGSVAVALLAGFLTFALMWRYCIKL